MAVTITPEDVAVAIRAVTDGDNIPEPVAKVIGVVFPAASAIILQYAPHAPDAVHDAAMVRLCGWLYDAEPAAASAQQPLQASGTMQLLAQWKVQVAGALTPGPETPNPADIPAPPENGSYVLVAVNGEEQWIEFPVPS